MSNYADSRKETFFCKKCAKTMRGQEFYGTNNLEKYPEGKLDMCKKCATLHVNNWEPSTYLWLLQECDVPYIPKEWDKLMSKYAKDPSKVTGATILGRYLGSMKLNQYTKYRWKDTKFLQELEDKTTRETMARQGYEVAEIESVIQQNQFIIPEGPISEPAININSAAPFPQDSYSSQGQNQDYFSRNDEEEDLDLTPEDKRYLRLKWGKTYRPEEWVRLEQLYIEMTDSYDIQGAGHEDTLKIICKASLKTNQLLDLGDIEGAQKAAKMYDSLMKSGRFTAAQNKVENGECLNSISELTLMCETEGFIPRFYVDKPNDRVDETIMDMKDYTRSLVTEERNLGDLIENAIKEMAMLEAKEEDEDIDEDTELTLAQVDALKDADFEEFRDFIEAEEDETDEYLRGLE